MCGTSECPDQEPLICNNPQIIISHFDSTAIVFHIALVLTFQERGFINTCIPSERCTTELLFAYCSRHCFSKVTLWVIIRVSSAHLFLTPERSPEHILTSWFRRPWLPSNNRSKFHALVKRKGKDSFHAFPPLNSRSPGHPLLRHPCETWMSWPSVSVEQSVEVRKP